MAFMEQGARIYVAGHTGLVGSAIQRRLHSLGYTNVLVKTHEELDLTDGRKVKRFFLEEHPEYVFVAAAKVGGIAANSRLPAEFIHQNLAIELNVIDSAYRSGTKRLLFLGSSCIYPKLAPQPITEDCLLSGPLEPTNRPYAIAKIAGVEMCWSYNRQYGTRFVCVMPTNLYGPGDSYDLTNSHVIPAIIRKLHEAKIRKDKTVTLWGTGNPRREFLYSDDLGEACVFLMNLDDDKFNSIVGDPRIPPLINIGSGEDLTIRELANLVARTVMYEGDIDFDNHNPDGTPRKLLDVSRIVELGWECRTDLQKGLAAAYSDFLTRTSSSPTQHSSGRQKLATI